VKDPKKFYTPTVDNEFTRVARVVVMTNDDATIYINLLVPSEPEMMIVNNTE
jgi:hypothetical protein